MAGGNWDTFDITNLVKEWKNGTQNGQCGFVMTPADPTLKTGTISCEYTTTDYRPYVVFTYSNTVTINPVEADVYKGDTVTLDATVIPSGQSVTWTSTNTTVATVADGEVKALSEGKTTIRAAINNEVYAECAVNVIAKQISLNYTTIDVDENHLFTLTAATIPDDETVTWESSNPSIATVTNGKVTGIQAGTTTIVATLEDGASATCTVYVTIADGVYYIKNASSGNCLEATVSNAYLYEQELDQTQRLNQLWKMAYVSNGNYVIRPMFDLSAAMTVNASGYVAVADAAVDNASVSNSSLWKINCNAFGYTFKLSGSDSETIMPIVADMPGSQVYPGAWNSSLTCHWELESICGVFLRDAVTLQTVTSSTEKNLMLGVTYTLTDLDLSWEYYGSLIGGPSWSCDDTSVASANSSGTVKAVSYGQTLITLHVTINGVYYSASVSAFVSPFPDGTYRIQNNRLDG